MWAPFEITLQIIKAYTICCIALMSHESCAGCILIFISNVRGYIGPEFHMIYWILASISYSHIINSSTYHSIFPQRFVSQLFHFFPCCCRNLNTILCLTWLYFSKGIRYFWSEESLPLEQPLLLNPALLVSLSAILQTPPQSQKLFKSHISPMVLGPVLQCSSH